MDRRRHRERRIDPKRDTIQVTTERSGGEATQRGVTASQKGGGLKMFILSLTTFS